MDTQCLPHHSQLDLITHSISTTQNAALTAIPQKEEILDALKGMNANGAPGPDRFSNPLYIHFLDIIAPDLTTGIQPFFQGLPLPKSWPATSFILIPEITNDTRIEQLCPH